MNSVDVHRDLNKIQEIYENLKDMAIEIPSISLTDSTKLIYSTAYQYYLNIQDAIEKFQLNAIEETAQRIGAHFEFIEQDVEVRIESLRLKLDEIQDSFKKQIEESKERMKKYVSNKMSLALELENEIQNIEDLKLDEQAIEVISSVSAEHSEQLNSIKQNEPEVKLVASESNSCDCTIGKTESTFSENLSLMEDFQYDTFDIGFIIKALIKLNTNKFLILKRFSDKSLLLTDSNFKVLKKLQFVNDCMVTLGDNEKPDVNSHYLFAMTCDARFIYSIGDSVILKFDHDFNLIQKIPNRYNSGQICCDKENIYVGTNGLLIVYTKDLVLIKSKNIINDSPTPSMSVTNNVVCLVASFKQEMKSLYYSLPDLELIAISDEIFNSLTAHNNCFCGCTARRICCFDTKGEILYTTKFRNLAYVLYAADNHLYICFEKEIVKLKIPA